MKLYFAPFSPFARKCRVVMIEKGLVERITLVNVVPMEDPPELLAINPLATVPALLTDDNKIFCESPVICEYLDSLSSVNPLFPTNPKERFDVLGLAAFADGIMDAAVACVVESRRPEEKRVSEWIVRKERAVMHTIGLIAHRTFSASAPLNIGIINVVVALNYVSFRLPHLNWRGDYPVLAKWYDEISQRPSLASTAPIA